MTPKNTHNQYIDKLVEVRLREETLPGLAAGWYRARIDRIVETGTVVATLTDAGDHTDDQVAVESSDCRLIQDRSKSRTLKDRLR